MGWFRSNRRLWGIAALLALSLQIALSFGHVHGLEANHAGGVVSADAGGQIPAPSPPGRADHQDTDYCAICAVLALLSGAQTATAPAVVQPIALASTEIAIPGDALRVASRRVAFRSRAPPLI
jgi:hypothetical protein